MKKYPKAFSTPTVEGYGIAVDMGVTRTLMEKGRHRQRRRYRTMPHSYQFQFVVSKAQLDSWQQWVNGFAYDWFEMDMASMASSGSNTNCAPHQVRFTGDLAIAPINEHAWRVTVTAESAPLGSWYSPPVALTNDWIVAGTPPAPAPTDDVEAGSPSVTFIDFVEAGSPSGPAAYV